MTISTGKLPHGIKEKNNTMGLNFILFLFIINIFIFIFIFRFDIGKFVYDNYKIENLWMEKITSKDYIEDEIKNDFLHVDIDVILLDGCYIKVDYDIYTIIDDKYKNNHTINNTINIVRKYFSSFNTMEVVNNIEKHKKLLTEKFKTNPFIEDIIVNKIILPAKIKQFLDEIRFNELRLEYKRNKHYMEMEILKMQKEKQLYESEILKKKEDSKK